MAMRHQQKFLVEVESRVEEYLLVHIVHQYRLQAIRKSPQEECCPDRLRLTVEGAVKPVSIQLELHNTISRLSKENKKLKEKKRKRKEKIKGKNKRRGGKRDPWKSEWKTETSPCQAW